MKGFAWIAGMIVGGLIGQWFGALGGLVVLGGLGGLFLGQLYKRLERLSDDVARLQASAQSPLTSASAQGQAPASPAKPADAARPPAAPAMQAPSLPAMTPATTPVTTPATTTVTEWPSPPVAPPPLAHPPVAPRSAQAAASAPSLDGGSARVTSSLGASLLAWLRGGNTIVRLGVLILFIGVAFLLRYAAEHSQLSIELRLLGVALGGVGLTALGLRLAPQRRGYGLSLQGAGVGVVYLLLFAAYRLYSVLPVGLSFALLAALAAITTVLALRQDALALAALGFGGAFLAPVLTSTGQGSHTALFSYQLLLNLAIAWMARHKAWKLLNLEGFVFTFGIGAAWGHSAYRPELFWSTEPFLLAHFLLYLYITVQYALRLTEAQAHDAAPEKPKLALVDGSLLFGLPIVAFSLQAALLRGQPMALAFSAAALAAIYLLLGQTLWKRAGGRLLLLIEGMVALGLIFLALVTPLALDARWSSAAWALQGAGVLWVALRQQRGWAALMGLLLQLGAAFSLGLAQLHSHPSGGTLLFFNSDFLGALLLTLASGFSAFCLHRDQQKFEQSSAQAKPSRLAAWLRSPWPEGLMLALAAFTLWHAGQAELLAWDQKRWDAPALSCFWSGLLVLGLTLSQRRYPGSGLRWVARALMSLALLYSGLAVLDLQGTYLAWTRYLQGWGALEAVLLLALGAWRLAVAAPLAAHQKFEARVMALEHLLLAWYALLQGSLFLYTLATELVKRHEGWTPAAAIVLPTLLGLSLLARWQAQRWPMRAQDGLQNTYHVGLLQPLWLLLLLWVWGVNAVCDASMAPLPYLPLLNPLDLAHGLVLLYGLSLRRQCGPHPARALQLLALGAAFWWLNSLLVRSLHHWADTPMWIYGALESAPVQTGLSVLWTLCALLTMLWATRRAPPAQARRVWMVGAVLLGVVVLKLFLIDLSHLGSLQRIISFLVVGGLMLVIGYVSPLPPSAAPAKPRNSPS